MQKVNFDLIKDHVRTQYGDLTGVIQIDGHSNITSIYKLCIDYEFETEDKFIMGFSLTENTLNGIGESNKVSCSVLFVNKADYGNNFEEIEAKIKADGTLKLQKKNFYIKYSDLGKYIKRYNFLAMSELSRFASEIEIDESADND